MNSVLISTQPYYVFLIIAKIMGWNIPQKKTVEVRKNYPKDKAWNKITHIYCSKNRKSFNRIPKEYQPLMQRFLGKVIGEFVCDRIDEYECYPELPYDKYNLSKRELEKMCLICHEVDKYGKGKSLYGWHISDLKIYDKPRELSEFYKPLRFDGDYVICGTEREMKDIEEWDCQTLFDIPQNTPCDLAHCSKLRDFYRITKAPQSWCYGMEANYV